MDFACGSTDLWAACSLDHTRRHQFILGMRAGKTNRGQNQMQYLFRRRDVFNIRICDPHPFNSRRKNFTDDLTEWHRRSEPFRLLYACRSRVVGGGATVDTGYRKDAV